MYRYKSLEACIPLLYVILNDRDYFQKMQKKTNKQMVVEWIAHFLSRDLFMNLSRSFSFRPARGSIYIINHKLSTTRSTNRCAAVQIRLEQSSTPTIQDYKQRVSTINWDHSIVNEDLILFSKRMHTKCLHSFSLVTGRPWNESCKIFKATLQTPRTLTLRSPGTSRTSRPLDSQPNLALFQILV